MDLTTANMVNGLRPVSKLHMLPFVALVCFGADVTNHYRHANAGRLQAHADP